jgi:hypothetical protein
MKIYHLSYEYNPTKPILVAALKNELVGNNVGGR